VPATDHPSPVIITAKGSSSMVALTPTRQCEAWKACSLDNQMVLKTYPISYVLSDSEAGRNTCGFKYHVILSNLGMVL
jgi:hypothetical protein